MNSVLKRGFILILIMTMIFSWFCTINQGYVYASAPTDAGNLVVTGYSVTPSYIYKNSRVKAVIYMKHTKLTASDISDDANNLDISRLVDSFSGGGISTSLTSSGTEPLQFAVTVDGLTYSGSGNALKLMVGYKNISDKGYDSVEIPILEAEEYVEPTPSTPAAPEPSPAPILIVSRNDMPNPVTQNAAFNVTLTVKNTGTVTVKTPVLTVSASESLMLTGTSSSYQLPDIDAGKTQSVIVPLRAADTITSANQNLTTDIKFIYYDGVSNTQGTATDKITIPAKVKKTEEPSDTAGPVPNIIIDRFNYGGGSVAAGSNFTLSFRIKNTSKLKNVENMVVTVDGGTGLTINGSSNTFFYSKIEAAGTSTVSVPMKAQKTITEQVQIVSVNFKYEYQDQGKRLSNTSDIKITVPVYQPDHFEISNPVVPDYISEGDEVSITMNYVNKSKTTINNVEASIEGNVTTVTPVQNVGNLEPGKNGAIAFSVTADTAGLSEFTIKVSYEDGNGDLKSREFPVSMDVQAMEPYDPGTEDPVVDEPEQGGGIPWWIFVIAAVLVVGGIIFFKKHKKKKAAAKEAALWDSWDDEDKSQEENK